MNARDQPGRARYHVATTGVWPRARRRPHAAVRRRQYILGTTMTSTVMPSRFPLKSLLACQHTLTDHFYLATAASEN
jgi:hypothetical protein